MHLFVQLKLIHNEDVSRIAIHTLSMTEIESIVQLFKENQLQDWNPFFYQFFTHIFPRELQSSSNAVSNAFTCFVNMLSAHTTEISMDTLNALQAAIDAVEHDFNESFSRPYSEEQTLRVSYLLCCMQSLQKMCNKHNEAFFISPVISEEKKPEVNLCKSETVVENIEKEKETILMQVRTQLSDHEYKEMQQCGLVQVSYKEWEADHIHISYQDTNEEEETITTTIILNEVNTIQDSNESTEETTFIQKEESAEEDITVVNEEESAEEEEQDEEQDEEQEEKIQKEEPIKNGVCIRFFRKICGK